MEQEKKTSYGALFGSFVAGAVIASMAGFTFGGWTTEGNATKMAALAAEEAAEEALIPFCIAKAKQDPEYAPKLALVKEASSWQRDDALMETGWATLPGYDEPDRGFADACAKAILAEQA